MSLARDKIVVRVLKLAALARSQNEHEAASARERLEALRREHKITDEEIAEHEARCDQRFYGDERDLDLDTHWREELALAIARAFGCRAMKADRHLAFSGLRGADALARYREVAGEIEEGVRWTISRMAGPRDLDRVITITFAEEATRVLVEHLTAPANREELQRELAVMLRQDVNFAMCGPDGARLRNIFGGWSSTAVWLHVRGARLDAHEWARKLCLRPDRTLGK